MTENQNVEYKQSWCDEYLKWICGFANAQGGVLEIGRNDKGEVVGVADAARLLENLPKRIMSACRAAGVPVPGLRYEQTGLWVEFAYRPPETTTRKTREETREKTREKTPVKMLVKTPERILEVLAVNSRLTLAEVADIMGKSLSAVERASAKLVKERRLRYVGPRKGGHWEIIRGDNE